MISKSFRKRFKSAFRTAELGVGALAMSARSLLDATRIGARPPRGPYVQNVSAYSAVICWTSEEPDVGVVEYGESLQLGRVATDPQIGKRHAVVLSGLEPGSTYHYRVEGLSGSMDTGRFQTAPEGDGSFVFVVIGDSGNAGKGQMAVAGLLERLKPDLILHTGDVVYPSGKDRHYDRRFFTPYRHIIKDVPVFPTLGNHDVETRDGAAYLENFYLPRNNPQNTGRYYSFDWGNVHFVALDSELYHDDGGGSPEKQKDWLERDLSETWQPWKIVYFHRGIYSSSDHGGDEEIRRDLEPVLVRHGVDVVFSGHDHDYERTLPIEGVTYVVTGGGGKDLYPAGTSEWTAFSRSVHHAVLVRIDGERLSLEAIDLDGVVFDRLELHRS